MANDKKAETQDETTGLETLISLGDAAEELGCTPGQLRRLAKKGEVPGAVKVFGRFWGFDAEALEGFEVPEAGEGVARRRPDGRRRLIVYVNKEEHEVLVKAGLEIVDPREARKARKAAAKAQEQEEGSAGEGSPKAETSENDPFAAFGG